MNKQEAFDKAWRGVVKQGKKSIAWSECRYKMVDADGAELRCAVGYLLTDEQLACLMGQNPSAFHLVDIIKTPIIDGDAHEQRYFLGEIQKAHDVTGFLVGPAFIKEFKERMSDLAEDAGLTIPTDV